MLALCNLILVNYKASTILKGNKIIMTIIRDIKTRDYIATETWKGQEFIAISSDRMQAITDCTDLIWLEFSKICKKFKG